MTPHDWTAALHEHEAEQAGDLLPCGWCGLHHDQGRCAKLYGPTDAEIDRAQRRLEGLFGKEWLMEGVTCLECGKPWKEWLDREYDHCGCKNTPEYLAAIDEFNGEKRRSERESGGWDRADD